MYSILSISSFRFSLQPRLLAYGDSIRFYFCVLLPLRGGWLRGGWLSWYGLSSATVLGRDHAMPIADYILLSSFFPLTFLPFVPIETFWPTEIQSDSIQFFFCVAALTWWMAFVVVWCGVLLYPILHRHRRRQRRCRAGIVQCRLPIVFPVLSFPFLPFHLLRKGS